MQKDERTTEHLYLGRTGELLVASEFIQNNFDVFSAEVDDKGIDLVVKNGCGAYFDIQVKSTNQTYVFMRKKVFVPRKNLFVALLILDKKGNKNFALIPSLEFKKKNKPPFLKDKDYEGKKSPPEYGIQTSDTHLGEILKQYSFSKVIKNLKYADNSVAINQSGT